MKSNQLANSQFQLVNFQILLDFLIKSLEFPIFRWCSINFSIKNCGVPIKSSIYPYMSPCFFPCIFILLVLFSVDASIFSIKKIGAWSSPIFYPCSHVYFVHWFFQWKMVDFPPWNPGQIRLAPAAARRGMAHHPRGPITRRGGHRKTTVVPWGKPRFFDGTYGKRDGKCMENGRFHGKSPMFDWERNMEKWMQSQV